VGLRKTAVRRDDKEEKKDTEFFNDFEMRDSGSLVWIIYSLISEIVYFRGKWPNK